MPATSYLPIPSGTTHVGWTSLSTSTMVENPDRSHAGTMIPPLRHYSFRPQLCLSTLRLGS
ncbi:hypothetical protein D9M69_330690 [compost metagenome]